MEIEFYAWLLPDPEDCCLVETAGTITGILDVNSDYGNSGKGEAVASH